MAVPDDAASPRLHLLLGDGDGGWAVDGAAGGDRGEGGVGVLHPGYDDALVDAVLEQLGNVDWPG